MIFTHFRYAAKPWKIRSMKMQKICKFYASMSYDYDTWIRTPLDWMHLLGVARTISVFAVAKRNFLFPHLCQQRIRLICSRNYWLLVILVAIVNLIVCAWNGRIYERGSNEIGSACWATRVGPAEPTWRGKERNMNARARQSNQINRKTLKLN